MGDKIRGVDGSMEILNYLENKSYYAQITPKLRNSFNKKGKKIKENIKNRNLKIKRNTLNRIRNKESHWCNLKDLIELSEVLGIRNEELFKNINKIKTKNSFPILLNRKSLVSPAFFRIIGHLLGDGGIHIIEKEKKYRPFYVNNQKELLESFSNDVKRVFGESKIYTRKREEHGDEIWLPTTLGVILYNILNYEKHNKKKRVPEFILCNDNKVLLGNFLQALYDDEGFLYPQKQMIVIAQKNRELLDEIRLIVLKLGINPNPIHIHSSKNRTTMHYFSITGRENILKFNTDINFLHPVKRQKLKILVRKYRC